MPTSLSGAVLPEKQGYQKTKACNYFEEVTSGIVMVKN
jgi:hypothetical protein